jgi:hypothetical protein
MIRSDAEDFLTFFGKLNGGAGTFLLAVPGSETNRGTASGNPGTPIVNGSSQVGNDLNISGAPNNEIGWLLPGDFIQIDVGANTRYHKVLTPVDTTGIGDAGIVIWPSLRESPPDTTAIDVVTPKGIFRLRGDDPVQYAIDTALKYRFEIDVEEVV